MAPTSQQPAKAIAVPPGLTLSTLTTPQTTVSWTRLQVRKAGGDMEPQFLGPASPGSQGGFSLRTQGDAVGGVRLLLTGRPGNEMCPVCTSREERALSSLRPEVCVMYRSDRSAQCMLNDPPVLITEQCVRCTEAEDVALNLWLFTIELRNEM